MLNVKKTLTKILTLLTPPSSVQLESSGIYHQVLRSAGTGMNLYIALPKAPATVSGTGTQVFVNNSWINVTPDSFAMHGSTCVIRLSFTATIDQGFYGIRGTLNFTY